MKKLFYFNLFLVQFFLLNAQTDKVLFTIDGEEIGTEEFERVYTKNNINNQADYSKASLDEYLSLFVNFKLKVTEAEALQMDTIPAIKSELKTYQKQLVKNYANDKEVSEALLKEAYERSKLEIDASHILIRWTSDYPSAADSALALRTILNLKKKLSPGNFDQIAKASSQDPSAKANLGKLGYLTVFQTVYPFENALYNTAPGKISEPIATQFGYHLVLVHDVRPARGRIKTAHVLIKQKEIDNEAAKADARAAVFKIYNELKAGDYDFASAVKLYSQDAKTKYQGGTLPELSSAEMITEFAEAAFGLKKDGDFSEPVLTAIGWHIIQRVSKTEIASFEIAQTDLDNRISRDSRSNVAQIRNIEDSKKQFGYTTNKKNQEALFTAMVKSLKEGKVTLNEKSFQAELFTIGGDKFKQADFIEFVKASLKPNKETNEMALALKLNFDKYQNIKIQDYREIHLAEINEDYKNLMQEYHDGILLFELTDREVWSKAVMDTLGLREFYESNKMNYMWKDRVIYNKFEFLNETAAEKGIKLLSKGKTPALVLSKLNKKENLVSLQNFKLEKASMDPQDLPWEANSSKKELNEDGSISYYLVDKVVGPELKKLSETRGYVISDYQNFLEKEWIERLKEKYEVNLNNEVFNALIKK
jgi:peptidyl-prolyl cis-trans isomerase SurA